MTWLYQPLLGGAAAQAGGPVTHSGSGSATLPLPTALGDGLRSLHGSGTPSLPSMTATGAGTKTLPGSGAPSLPAMTATGAGTRALPGSGVASLPGLTATGAGTKELSGSGTPSLPPLTADGAGQMAGSFAGTGDASLPALTADGAGAVIVAASFGGDDAPDRGHRGYGQRRAKIKRDRDREFDEHVRGIYRALVSDPRTAERAGEIVASVVPDEVPTRVDHGAEMDARAVELRRRADALDARAVQAEIALRLLYADLREMWEREDMDALNALLPELIALDVEAVEGPRQRVMRELWDDEYDLSELEAMLAEVI